MKKMPCLFQREFHAREGGKGTRATLLRSVTPGCEWVLEGEGVASRKWDGTACAFINGSLYKRYDAKKNPRTGEYKLPPEGAVPCDPAPDLETGHWPHWVRVECGRPEDVHFVRAKVLALDRGEVFSGGTYELIGPPINGNPDGAEDLQFRKHGDVVLEVPRTFDGLREYLEQHRYEGIVFQRESGERCKIRRLDFGLPWPVKDLG